MYQPVDQTVQEDMEKESASGKNTIRAASDSEAVSQTVCGRQDEQTTVALGRHPISQDSSEPRDYSIKTSVDGPGQQEGAVGGKNDAPSGSGVACGLSKSASELSEGGSLMTQGASTVVSGSSSQTAPAEEQRIPQDSQQEDTKEKKTQMRKITITVCTSAAEANISQFMSYLSELKKEGSILIKDVQYHRLPYNDLDSYRFSENIDVMVLCHSINNRGFAITDVTDALYDKYLAYCHNVIGKEKIAVIAHDIEDIREGAHATLMSKFRLNQPTVFKTSSLALTCGRLGEGLTLRQDDVAALEDFFRKAATCPKNMNPSWIPTWFTDKSFYKDEIRPILSSKVGVEDTEQLQQGHSQRPSGAERGPLADPNVHADTPAVPLGIGTISMAATPPLRRGGGIAARRISVSVCSSVHKDNIECFVSKLETLRTERRDLIADVQVRELPYNDIDSFWFDSNDPVDVMVLCHSIHNRGFSITNVPNALYEKYLHKCCDVIGKEKVAVIVHDIPKITDKDIETKMGYFKRTQSLTFDLAEAVMICGDLSSKVNMRDSDWEDLVNFFENASKEPRENRKGKVTQFFSSISSFFM